MLILLVLYVAYGIHLASEDSSSRDTEIGYKHSMPTALVLTIIEILALPIFKVLFDICTIYDSHRGLK
jgi:hypothetical protein